MKFQITHLVNFWLIYSTNAQLTIQSTTHYSQPHKLDEIYIHSLARIKANINPPGSILGTLVASPSKDEPDYFYDWVRDSALVYRALNDFNFTKDYINVVYQHQRYDFGEPKFYVNGKVFEKPWGRPQNDGSALRIITLCEYILEYAKQGGDLSKLKHLYRKEFPAKSIIKRDLEFISHNWHEKSFDLWEEVYGDHFYTRMVQQAALEIGSEIALMFDDFGAHYFYQKVALEIRDHMEAFWSKEHEYVQAILHSDRLDIALVLACLHSRVHTYDAFECKSDRILQTVARLHFSFKTEYPINYNQDYILYGRYSSDLYDGTGISVGNPWFLASFSIAELLYTIVHDFYKDGYIIVSRNSLLFYHTFIRGVITETTSITNKSVHFKYVLANLTNVADEIMTRALNYGYRFSEQIDRYDGFKRGAPDLSWSYASFVTAYRARKIAHSILA